MIAIPATLNNGVSYTEYTDAEIRQQWYNDTHNGMRAQARSDNCFVIACREDIAVMLCRLYNRVTGCPLTNCNYNGNTLSIYVLDGLPHVTAKIMELLRVAGTPYVANVPANAAG